MLALYATADAYFGMGELVNRAAQQEGTKHLREACDWYHKSADAWRQIPNPGRTTPRGFAAGNPREVANKLSRCEAVSLPQATKN